MQIIIGQVFGWLAAIFGFVTYQCKTQKQILFTLSLSGISLCVSYFFLGAYSGMLLNFIGLIRNFIFDAKDKRIFSFRWWPAVLAAVMGFVGILSWQGPASLLVVIALVVYTLFLGAGNAQNLRKCILLTSTLVLLYNLYYKVWGGVLYESVAIFSAIIGLIRFRKKDASAQEDPVK